MLYYAIFSGNLLMPRFSIVLGSINLATLSGINVFKGKSVMRDVFMSVRRGISLEALRRKPFVMTNII